MNGAAGISFAVRAAGKREAGENPARSRHRIRGAGSNCAAMARSLRNREDLLLCDDP